MQPAVKREFQGEILRKRGIGNFTLLEGVYRPNQVLPRHTHEQAYVSVALRGAYRESCGMQSWDCRDGGAIFHIAGESHSNRFYDTGARLLILEIKPAFISQLHEQGVVTDRQSWLTSSYCRQLAFRLNRMLPLTDPLSALSAEGLGIELLSETLRPHFLKPVRSEPDWLRKVNEILHESLSRAAYAERAGWRSRGPSGASGAGVSKTLPLLRRRLDSTTADRSSLP